MATAETAAEAATEAAEEAADETTKRQPTRQPDSLTDFSRHFKMFQDETILEKTFQEMFKNFIKCLGIFKMFHIFLRTFEIFLKSHAAMHKFCAC